MQHLEESQNSVPSNTVKSFLKINFQSTSRAYLPSMRVSNELMGEKDIVYNVPPIDKGCLIMGNDGGKNHFESISKNF